VCFSICTFFSVSRHIPGPTMGFSAFPFWSVILPYSRSYSVHFSFFTVSCNIPGHLVFVFLLACFSVFLTILHVSLSFSSFFRILAIFQVLLCVCVTFSTFFSFLTTVQVLECVFLILHIFPCFLPYFSSYHGFLIFLVCQFSRHIQGPIVSVSHFAHLSFFSTYSRSYSVCFSFFKFFSFFLHIPGPTRCFSHFSSLSVFLPYSSSYSVHFSFFMFSVFSPYSTSYSVCFSFSTFISCFLPKFRSHSVYFSYFMFFHSFSLYSRSYSLCFFLPVFSVSRLISYPNMLVYHFPLFFRILAIFQVLECVSHFPRFSVFPPQSRS
jgi:hypothetical protein